MPGTVGLGGRMSQNPLKVTIFGASTGSLGRSVVYELGRSVELDLMDSFSGSDMHDSIQRRRR